MQGRETVPGIHLVALHSSFMTLRDYFISSGKLKLQMLQHEQQKKSEMYFKQSPSILCNGDAPTSGLTIQYPWSVNKTAMKTAFVNLLLNSVYFLIVSLSKNHVNIANITV